MVRTIDGNRSTELELLRTVSAFSEASSSNRILTLYPNDCSRLAILAGMIDQTRLARLASGYKPVYIRVQITNRN
jgi:hypothetical protein